MRPTSAPATEDFLPLLASIWAVAAARSPSSSPFSILSRKPATAKLTAAARTTDRVTPTKLPAGVAIQTAMIEPGEATLCRPESSSWLVATPVMPPRMTARTIFGFIST